MLMPRPTTIIQGPFWSMPRRALSFVGRPPFITCSVLLRLVDPTALYRQGAASACPVAESSGGCQRATNANLRWLARHLSTLLWRSGDRGAIRRLLRPHRPPWLSRVNGGAHALSERLKERTRADR